ncbi:hypothetical protein BDM02DRAFT_3127393 [Thelephora ganbajun]|uniref:Uncharacterized protein n=1 Tax=Thelephora ganbajun TaxID=370292 RepID=A0ACB6ZM74_THEGA|nr:hypothetical protein BDM02DRAFT_3127393 [Thelephora ganbajun]
MDLRSPDSQVDTFESAFRPESYSLFTYYHPQYQSEYPVYQDGQYASFIFDNTECLGESAYHPSTTSFPTNFDPSGGHVALSILGSQHDQFFAQHAATIPPGKMSTYSELMPHVVAHKTTVSLKQDVRVATKPQPCVSPALCQGHADLPECAEIDDELDCPGEPIGDEDAESSDEEDDEHSSPLPPPSPCSTPFPSPSPSHSSSSHCCEPPRTSHVIRSARTQNRYSPMEAKPHSSRKGKSAIRRASCGSDDEDSKKPKKRREAVSLACYFCRKRKIACRQPPEGTMDRTCNQCKTRGMECEYPTESRRGARRGSASSAKHAH